MPEAEPYVADGWIKELADANGSILLKKPKTPEEIMLEREPQTQDIAKIGVKSKKSAASLFNSYARLI